MSIIIKAIGGIFCSAHTAAKGMTMLFDGSLFEGKKVPDVDKCMKTVTVVVIVAVVIVVLLCCIRLIYMLRMICGNAGQTKQMMSTGMSVLNAAGGPAGALKLYKKVQRGEGLDEVAALAGKLDPEQLENIAKMAGNFSGAGGIGGKLLSNVSKV